ncbi:MAG: hypothetical protein O2923_14675 [Verrucomicrobia bacterium]|nr:hypothetical protein [Verrucomicrobiota bacterium]MDA1088632.1 hypothetical protein [Verrucomicrobiota bacterium]
MSAIPFQFSPAARLYAENAALVEEMRNSNTEEGAHLFAENKALIDEMRDEAYENIEAFGELLLKELSLLPWENEELRLCEQATYTVKAWRGHRINYRWLRPVQEQFSGPERKQEHGCVALSFPVTRIVREVDDSAHLQDYFRVITHGDLGVGVVCDADDEHRRHQITALVQDKRFGAFVDISSSGDWGNIRIPINSGDPLRSAVETTRALLRAVYQIENPGSVIR